MIREYYKNKFREKLAAFMPDKRKQYFGHEFWNLGRNSLDALLNSAEINMLSAQNRVLKTGAYLFLLAVLALGCLCGELCLFC
jgi:hypothetical protein